MITVDFVTLDKMPETYWQLHQEVTRQSSSNGNRGQISHNRLNMAMQELRELWLKDKYGEVKHIQTWSSKDNGIR